ncbi:MAG: LPS export ABC transporter ATP-binding protein [Planctomycetes bacterium]|nr:LPS export ABC transporter ATP-binding protein [Planctomycetota bacterium]
MKRATTPRRGDLLLEAEGLVKAYKRRRVVDGVHFQVRAGEIVGLLGPNGAGKTTSFRMTVGLIQPDEGRVKLNGSECSKMPMYKRARLGMGYLPQEPSIFRRMSVKDNLLAVLEAMPYGRRERHREADRLMSELELTRLAKNIAETLSGGERRRLELCRALATKPTILLLDEPFAGVDPINVQEIQGLIEQMREKDLGILITDHNVRETLKSTDRAYIIYEGKILREGTATELIQDERVKEVYLGHSFDAPLTQGVSAAEEREFFEDPPEGGAAGLSDDEQRGIQDDGAPPPSGKPPPKKR